MSNAAGGSFPGSPAGLEGEKRARVGLLDRALGRADVCSYGGGRQTTALLVLAAQGVVDIPVFVYANVGDDCEPETLRYVHEVAWDYATEHGIEMHEVGPARGISLRQRFLTAPSGHETIPIRGENGMPFKRGCTAEWKVGEVDKFLRARGFTEEHPATSAIGFSTDEYMRVNGDRAGSLQQRVYPLLHIEWNGLTGLSLSNCIAVIRDAGLPVPPKSDCFFCPFHKPSRWSEIRRDRTEEFDESCRMEDVMNAKRIADGKKPAYFSRFGKPLRDAIPVAQDALFIEPDWDEEDYRCGDQCGT